MMDNESRQDRAVRGLMEAGEIRTWVDELGLWHADVSEYRAHSLEIARVAIRIELQDRAAHGTSVPLPQVRLVDRDSGVWPHHRAEYVQAAA